MIILCKWNTQVRNWDKQQKSKNNGTFAKGFSTNKTDDQTNTKDPGGVPEKIGHKDVLAKKKIKIRKLISEQKLPKFVPLSSRYFILFHLAKGTKNSK